MKISIVIIKIDIILCSDMCNYFFALDKVIHKNKNSKSKINFELIKSG